MVEQEHDVGLKDILSNPKSFAELVRTFIVADWVKYIVADNLELINAEFIVSTFGKRNADIIYKFRHPDNPEQVVYFYCITELQSKVDYSMPIRLFVYMAYLWVYVLKGKSKEEIERKGFRLPPIIPIVLYNGKDPWTVPKEFASVYQGDYNIFKGYALNFEYYLIDINRYAPEDLLKRENLISAVFYVDQRAGTENMDAYINRLPEKLSDIEPVLRKIDREDKREANLFINWLKGIVLERIPEGDEALRAMLREVLGKIEKETEAYMYVSNLSVELGNFWRMFQENLNELQLAKEQLSRVEQERTMEREKLEQERALDRERLRKAVILMRKQGLSVDQIAAETGLNREELKTYTKE